MDHRPNPPFPYQARQWAVDGARVECFSGRDPSDVIHEGRIIGMTEAPTVRVQKDDGQIISWVLGITRKKADDLPVSGSTEPHPSADWLAGWEAACTDFDEWANWRWEICHARNASKQLLDAYSWASNHALVLRGDWTRAEVLREKRERGEPSVSGSNGTRGGAPTPSSAKINQNLELPVADSELRDRIAEALWLHEQPRLPWEDVHPYSLAAYRSEADAVMAVVAPVLAAKDDAIAMARSYITELAKERDRERATREKFQLIVNEAGEALRKISDQNPWEQPPSLMDRIELVAFRLASAVVVPEGWRQSMLLCLKAFEDEPWDAKVEAIGELLETWRTGEGNDRDVELPAVSLHSGTENESQPRWRTHPGTGVMHLLLPGTTRAICNAAESYAWRAAVDGNAKHTVCNELAGSASTAEGGAS